MLKKPEDGNRVISGGYKETPRNRFISHFYRGIYRIPERYRTGMAQRHRDRVYPAAIGGARGTGVCLKHLPCQAKI